MFFSFDTKTILHKLGSSLPRRQSAKKSRAAVLFEEGVSLMQKNKFFEACEKFRDCLHESKYGSESVTFGEDQLEKLIIPTLCNMAACSLELKQYGRASFYCQEVFHLRPHQKRALYLQSIIDVEVGSYKAALKFYRRK